MNYVPIEYLQTYHHGSLAIWKHHEKDGKRMTLAEIYASGAGHFMRAEEFEHFAWLTRSRLEFVPEVPFCETPSPNAGGLANRILDQVRLRLSPDEFQSIFWVITTALDDSFELGIKAAGGDVVDMQPRSYTPQRLPPSPAEEIAADWFTLPPKDRTKKRLIGMLTHHGEEG